MTVSDLTSLAAWKQQYVSLANNFYKGGASYSVSF
jgi:hypothetical protein